MKVIGFGDSILKGAVLTDGPTLKYSLLQAGFLEQVCLAKGSGRKSEPMQIIPKSLSRLWTDFFPDMPK